MLGHRLQRALLSNGAPVCVQVMGCMKDMHTEAMGPGASRQWVRTVPVEVGGRACVRVYCV